MKADTTHALSDSPQPWSNHEISLGRNLDVISRQHNRSAAASSSGVAIGTGRRGTPTLPL